MLIMLSCSRDEKPLSYHRLEGEDISIEYLIASQDYLKQVVDLGKFPRDCQTLLNINEPLRIYSIFNHKPISSSRLNRFRN